VTRRHHVAACVTDHEAEKCTCTSVDRAISNAPDVRDVALERIGRALWMLARKLDRDGFDPKHQVWAVYAAAERLMGSDRRRYDWRPTDVPALRAVLQRELDDRQPDSLSNDELATVARCFGFELFVEERQP